MKLVCFIIFVILNCAFGRDPKCPEGGDDLPFPHDTDCTKFYQCNGLGELIQMQCDNGLEFDPINLVNIFTSIFSKIINFI